MFRRLKLLFTHGAELEQVLIDIRKAKEDQEREDNRHRLRLCYKHRQEPNHSHYAEHNCDYCKVINEPKALDLPTFCQVKGCPNFGTVYSCRACPDQLDGWP